MGARARRRGGLLQGVFLAGAAAGIGPADATIWIVNPDRTGDFPTIQAAVDAASDGDEILLGDGVYYGVGNAQVDYRGKAITIRSHSGDPGLCAIDGAWGYFTCGAAFLFRSGETSSSVLEGVTVRHVYDGIWYAPCRYLGAINISGASPVLRNVVVRNSASLGGFGSAVQVSGGAPRFENCVITNNQGRGMDFLGSSATLTGCVIEANTALSSHGGGIAATGSDLVLTSCTIRRNTVGSVWQGPYRGGGILVSGGALSLDGCAIVENTADHEGGGVYAQGLAVLALSQVTIAGNRAATGGGFYGAGCSATIDRSILWENCAATGEDGYLEAPASLTFTCTDVDPARVSGPGSVFYGAGVLTADPLFCAPRRCTDPLSVEGIWSLQLSSPARDVPGCGMLGGVFSGCTVSIAPSSWARIKARYR